MLREMLHLLEQHGALSVGDLAQRLGTSEAMVRLMLEQLTRRGLLRAVGSSCGMHTVCTGCALHGLCSPGTAQPLLWETVPPEGRASAQ